VNVNTKIHLDSLRNASCHGRKIKCLGTICYAQYFFSYVDSGMA